MLKINEENEGHEMVILNELCEFTSEELIKMNTNINMLKNYAKLIGTGKDNGGLRKKINKIQERINKSISLETNNLKKVKQETKEIQLLQLQTRKMEETFIATVTNYNGAQKEIEQKQKAHILLTTSEENPPSDDEELRNPQRHSQVIRNLKQEEARMLEKQRRLMKIQTDIIDINKIMGELESMVKEQGEGVDEVEKHILEVSENVESGANELEEVQGHKKGFIKRVLYLSLIITAVTLVVAVVSCYQF